MSSLLETVNIKIPVSTASGNIVNYNVVLEGSSDRPLVVLVHALMANLRMWDSSAVALKQAGFRTLRFDYIGHGGTPDWTRSSSESRNKAADPPFLFDEFTQHIREMILKATGQDRVYAIIGCSMGGVLALRYSMMYPRTVSYVISCDAPGITSLTEAKPLWRERVKEFREYGSDDLTRKTVDRWLPEPCSAATKEAVLAQTRACTFVGYSVCAHAIQNYDYENELDKVKAKTLILAGEKDASIGPPEILQRAAKKISDARYVQIMDCGHLPPMHQPEEFERVMLEFLGKD